MKTIKPQQRSLNVRFRDVSIEETDTKKTRRGSDVITDRRLSFDFSSNHPRPPNPKTTLRRLPASRILEDVIKDLLSQHIFVTVKEGGRQYLCAAIEALKG